MPTKSSRPKRIPKQPGAAPGQALGYSLQFTRLVAMLLEAPEGSACSLEVLDDVAGETPSGQPLVSQTKSALTDNPVSDRGVPLWKTLHNWIEVAKRGFVDPARTIFEIYVSRTAHGDIVDSFHGAQSRDDAHSAIKRARTALLGSGNGTVMALGEGVERYVSSVFNADPDLLASIIAGLRLVCGSGSPQADLEAAIRRGPVSAAKVFDIADKMCGWVKRQVDKQLERQLPAVIARDDFHREYVAFVRSADRDNILRSFASRPSKEEQLKHLPDTFVQQLALIDLDFDAQLEAINDYLRASWDRATWSKSGEVHDDSFTELDGALCRTWKHLSRETKLQAVAQTENELGQLLYSRCMTFQTRIQGLDPPSHFIPGCFHCLADNETVGWHPSYKALLKLRLRTRG